MNSLEPGSHMLAKKTVYLFDTDFNFLSEMSAHTDWDIGNVSSVSNNASTCMACIFWNSNLLNSVTNLFSSPPSIFFISLAQNQIKKCLSMVFTVTVVWCIHWWYHHCKTFFCWFFSNENVCLYRHHYVKFISYVLLFCQPIKGFSFYLHLIG